MNRRRDPHAAPNHVFPVPFSRSPQCKTVRNPPVQSRANESRSSAAAPEALEAARAAAAIMGMTNVFYRFQHLAENKKYGTIPARLRMNAIRSLGIEPVDFELSCIAASAIDGCGVRIDSHEKVVREKGSGEDVILACVRIAPAIPGLATVLD